MNQQSTVYARLEPTMDPDALYAGRGHEKDVIVYEDSQRRSMLAIFSCDQAIKPNPGVGSFSFNGVVRPIVWLADSTGPEFVAIHTA